MMILYFNATIYVTPGCFTGRWIFHVYPNESKRILLLWLQFSNNKSQLINLPLDKIAAISQTSFSYAFVWMKSFFILIKMWLKSVPEVLIDNNLALV